MQCLRPVDYLISYIKYVMENDIKIELTKTITLSEGLSGRLRDFYRIKHELIDEHLQLIPEHVKEVVNKQIDDERDYIIKNFGGC